MRITRKEFLLLVAAAKGAAATAKRWAMAVDLAKCRDKEDCTRCIEACDRAHNIPSIPGDTREVKWIWKEPFERVFPNEQAGPLNARLRGTPAMVLCNHCENPPCVRVCPTGATWKRADGIVAMDWHRCIGCRYCVAACPYGSRSFNWSDPRRYIRVQNPDFPTRTKGVVEKCTFCEERLAKGQAPACVEVCPAKALVFGDINDPNSPVRAALGDHYSLRRKPELGTSPQMFYIL